MALASCPKERRGGSVATPAAPARRARSARTGPRRRNRVRGLLAHGHHGYLPGQVAGVVAGRADDGVLPAITRAVPLEPDIDVQPAVRPRDDLPVLLRVAVAGAVGGL